MTPADLLNEQAAAHAPGVLAEETPDGVQMVGPSAEVEALVALVGRAAPGWLMLRRAERIEGWTLGEWALGFPCLPVSGWLVARA